MILPLTMDWLIVAAALLSLLYLGKPAGAVILGALNAGCVPSMPVSMMPIFTP